MWGLIFSRKKKESPELEARPRFGWKKLLRIGDIGEAFYRSLEEALIEADTGGENTLAIIKQFREAVKEEKIKEQVEARKLLRRILKGFFSAKPLSLDPERLNALVVVGINGVGKTTTIAKLIHLLRHRHQMILGAADTFRAAAVDQLRVWGERLDVPLVSQIPGADPASVTYDTLHSGLAQGKSVALIDTAGRLHNNENLMHQLRKLIHISDKFKDQVRRQVLLVLDATQGISGFDQVKAFREKVPIDGLILTKCDTQAKGGILLTLVRHFDAPIHYYTYGENPDQMAPFDPDEYVDSLI